MHHAYLDEYTDLNSLIHRLDPRIKTIILFTFIIFIIMTKPGIFLSFACYALILMVLILFSRIPFGFILKKSLVVIPFVLLISISIPFIKNGRIIADYTLGNFKLRVTYEGLMSFFTILAKSYLSLLCMIILITTTKFSELLKAFQALKLPRIITLILSFMYRYIFVLQDELMKMQQAKESRSIGSSRWFHIKTLSNMIAVLFIRAYERAESVYLAMCSRGFRGEMRTINRFEIKTKDLFFLFIIIALLLSVKITVG
ncbi:MAG: cobalt ECF transporter T component CbiQ [Candidatus Omnitrophota bacterium]|nr:MAG: cobalt ECF transporter T component CbiQ [Candidatus Omnitrophota bacterium]